MKVAILLCANLSRAQYLQKYLSLLDKYGYDYDVVYWNRTLKNEEISCKGTYISYNVYMDSYKRFYKKIFDYLGFAKFANKVIERNNYDKLIILTTPMAVTILWKCFGKFRRKYLFDFRDLTKEYIGIYRYIVNKIAQNSNLFVISSLGYLPYFKNLKSTQICHNTLPNVRFKKKVGLNYNLPIRISYWGAIRQIEYNKSVCDMFGNDTRFNFCFFGDGAYKELKRYCKEKNYKNIYFTGRYELSEIEGFAQNTDILFNAYERDFVTTPSLAVKVYDSLEYRLPMLVSKGTYMEKYLKDMSYVCSINIEKKYTDIIYKWYKNLDTAKMGEDFSILMERVKHDEKNFEYLLKKFCEE